MLALGTKCEMRVPVGPGTLIPVVGVADSNPIYQVLLCQMFHHITVGMAHPLMGRFTFMPRYWDDCDASLVGTLEGMPCDDHEASHITQVTKAVQGTPPRPLGPMMGEPGCLEWSDGGHSSMEQSEDEEPMDG